MHKPCDHNSSSPAHKLVENCECVDSKHISTENQNFDVVIIGSGIAGLCALRAAVSQGARCALVCEGPLFSGGSFFPGTWGLGLIGPKDAGDEDSLISSVLQVGQGVADAALVEHFVRSINPTVSKLEQEGLELIHPANPDQREYIPCFDTELRRWRGLTHEALKIFFTPWLKHVLASTFPKHELLEISTTPEGTHSLLLFDKTSDVLCELRCSSLVLAAGGSGGLFKQSLTSKDLVSSVQGMALSAGCELLNIEFMQMMPGLLKPKKNLVFNEKVFRSLDLPFSEDILERRSGHGPFTVEWDDACVDELLFSAGEQGYDCCCTLSGHQAPEFVQTYDTWLEEQTGIKLKDGVSVGLYAHAANGGIAINAQAETSREGIYACGEITGGVHGADRIGGLSSANCMVFGSIAGKQAAEYARSRHDTQDEFQQSQPQETRALETKVIPNTTPQLQALDKMQLENLSRIYERLRELMSQELMIMRTHAGLKVIMEFCDQELEFLSHLELEDQHPRLIAAVKRLQSQLLYARAIGFAAYMRTESRGAHQRADYPAHQEGLKTAQRIKLGACGMQSNMVTQ